MKTLVIVESPTKAEKIQSYLGEDYIVIATKGHIADLAKNGDYNLGIDLDKEYKPRYITSDDRVDILKEIVYAIKKCDDIVLCSDPDREGEAISYHVYNRIVDYNKPIKRAVFHEITKKAIQKAISESRDLDMNLIRAQEARRVLDRIVGFMASPYVCRTFDTKKLSAGRVQSVVTRLVVDKEKEILNFKPETYWTAQVTLTDKKSNFIAKYENKITSQKEADDIKSKLTGNNFDSVFEVIDVIDKEEKRNPPAPLITSSLQQVMSKQYKFSADKTAKVSQALFEAGYITYIRTDSPSISEDALQELRTYLKDNNLSHPAKPFRYESKGNAQEAHECIRPTDITLSPSNNFAMTDPDEKLLYEVVWKYFVACQMTPAVYNTLKVSLREKVSNTLVKASGKALKDSGYMTVLGVSDDSKIDIPQLTKGQVVYLTKNGVLVEKKQTKPPARFNEATLLKTLEVAGIGRPSTYASLLTKINDRNYVEKKNEVYYPTELGTKVVDNLKAKFKFMDYDFTSKLEDRLDLIAAGKITYLETVDLFFKQFKVELNKAYTDSGYNICDKCDSPMVVRKSKTGDFLGCSNFPNCRNLRKI